MASPTPQPFISLEAFLSNLIFLVVIQDDDSIFESAFTRDFSPSLDEEYITSFPLLPLPSPFPLPNLTTNNSLPTAQTAHP